MRSVSAHALRAALGIRSLGDQSSFVRVNELGRVLRATNAECVRSCYSRIFAAEADGLVSLHPTISAGPGRSLVQPRKPNKLNRAIGTLLEAERNNIVVSIPSSPSSVSSSPVPAFPQLCASTVTLISPPVNPTVQCPLLLDLPHWNVGFTLCMPVYPTPSTLTVYTDGSYCPGSSKDGTDPTHPGLGVVFCKPGNYDADNPFQFNSNSCVQVKRGSPYSGKNYTAECLAILTAIHSVPLNCSLDIFTDCLSAIQALTCPLLSEGSRLRQGSRAILATIRQLIRLRRVYGARTSLKHVLAHTGAQDLHSRGNDYADSTADSAARDSSLLSECEVPFLLNEERAIFWESAPAADDTCFVDRKFLHVSGDVASALRKQLRQSGLHRWARHDKGSQGQMARTHGMSLLNRLDDIRRNENSSLLHFALMACTRQLQTADRTMYGASRTRESLLCPVCEQHEESALHCFQCPSVSQVAELSRDLVTESLTACICPALPPHSLSGPDRVSPFTCIRDMHWFDPSKPPAGCDFFPGWNYPRSRSRKIMENLDRHDRMAATIGILPPLLRDLFYSTPGQLGVQEADSRDLSKTLDRALSTLRSRLLSSSFRTYSTWFSLRHPTGVTHRHPPPGVSHTAPLRTHVADGIAIANGEHIPASPPRGRIRVRPPPVDSHVRSRTPNSMRRKRWRPLTSGCHSTAKRPRCTRLQLFPPLPVPPQTHPCPSLASRISLKGPRSPLPWNRGP
jgi:hypothetical protein